MSFNNSRKRILVRAADSSIEASERSTFEANAPGDLAVIIAQLHDLLDQEVYGSTGDLIKKYLKHITFHHDFDRVARCGLLELFEIDPGNVGTVEELNALAANQSNISALEYAAVALCLIIKRSGINRLEGFELLKLYAYLFKKCDILTVALPATWLVGVTEKQVDTWLKEHLPKVDNKIFMRYVAFGQKYVLIGSESFVGDRDREDEEAWVPEHDPEFEQPGSHVVPEVNDRVLSDDAEHDSIATGDEQEAHARGLALACSHKKAVGASEHEVEVEVEGAESDEEDVLPTVYVSPAPGDMVSFLKTVYAQYDARSDYPTTITHLRSDPVFDSIRNCGLIEYFEINENDLASEPLFERGTDSLQNAAHTLRTMLLSSYIPGDPNEIAYFVSVLSQAFNVCEGVTTILMPKEWVKDKEMFLEVFPEIEDVETPHRDKRMVLLGNRTDAPPGMTAREKPYDVRGKKNGLSGADPLELEDEDD